MSLVYCPFIKLEYLLHVLYRALMIPRFKIIVLGIFMYRIFVRSRAFVPCFKKKFRYNSLRSISVGNCPKIVHPPSRFRGNSVPVLADTTPLCSDFCFPSRVLL